MADIITETMKMAAINFAEWIEKEMWCLSHDDRFPETFGRWYNKPHPNIPREESKASDELWKMFVESERERLKTLNKSDVIKSVCPECDGRGFRVDPFDPTSSGECPTCIGTGATVL